MKVLKNKASLWETEKWIYLAIMPNKVISMDKATRVKSMNTKRMKKMSMGIKQAVMEPYIPVDHSLYHTFFLSKKQNIHFDTVFRKFRKFQKNNGMLYIYLKLGNRNNGKPIITATKCLKVATKWGVIIPGRQLTQIEYLTDSNFARPQ